MVGRDVQFQPDRAEIEAGAVKLEVRGLCARNDRDLPALREVSLELRAGEILGVAGVSGNGQRELAECIAGLRTITGGTVTLNGQGLVGLPVQERLKAGLSFVPEERNRHGTIGSFSVAENAILQSNNAPQFRTGPFYNFEAIRRYTVDLIQKFNIKTPGHETPIKNLSGGNVQKLILARELSRKPVVLIAAQPTRGVDIGASEYIRSVLMQQRSDGVAILLISEDLDEIMGLSDRIAVMYEGEIVGIIPREEADVEMLGMMMAGAQTA
jgi:ABC-type uncharacterized transport system ATPase subunit